MATLRMMAMGLAAAALIGLVAGCDDESAKTKAEPERADAQSSANIVPPNFDVILAKQEAHMKSAILATRPPTPPTTAPAAEGATPPAEGTTPAAGTEGATPAAGGEGGATPPATTPPATTPPAEGAAAPAAAPAESN